MSRSKPRSKSQSKPEPMSHPMKLKHRFVLVAIGCILTAYWLFSLPSSTPTKPAVKPQSTATQALESSKNITQLSTILPKSLEGTEAPTEFYVDDQGHLRASHSIRELFDYFLSTVGEEPLERVLARIRTHIDQHLTEPAASEAQAVLEQYITMKQALSELQQQLAAQGQQTGMSNNISNMREQLRLIKELRQSFLSPDIYAEFYSEEDRYDEIMLQRLTILQDNSLSDQERMQALTSFEQNLPEDIQQERQASQQHISTANEVSEARASGASDAEVYQIRSDAYGHEAAERMEILDQQRSQWDERIEEYRTQKSQLESSGLSKEDSATAINALQESMFSKTEIIRLNVLESME